MEEGVEEEVEEEKEEKEVAAVVGVPRHVTTGSSPMGNHGLRRPWPSSLTALDAHARTPIFPAHHLTFPHRGPPRPSPPCPSSPAVAMAGFVLTEAHVRRAFAPLAETADAAARDRFFRDWVAPDVTWTVADSAHSLAGTRRSLRAHAAATFDRLGARLRGPIRFDVVRVLVDAAAPGPDGSSWACVETRGSARHRAGGLPYDNDYVWLTRWGPDGRIVEVRSYFDTMLSEEVLREPAP